MCSLVSPPEPTAATGRLTIMIAKRRKSVIQLRPGGDAGEMRVRERRSREVKGGGRGGAEGRGGMPRKGGTEGCTAGRR